MTTLFPSLLCRPFYCELVTLSVGLICFILFLWSKQYFWWYPLFGSISHTANLFIHCALPLADTSLLLMFKISIQEDHGPFSTVNNQWVARALLTVTLPGNMCLAGFYCGTKQVVACHYYVFEFNVKWTIYH